MQAHRNAGFELVFDPTTRMIAANSLLLIPMKNASVFAVSLWLSLVATAAPADGIGKVGEKWIYGHEGTRPLSNPPAAIRGDRTNEVVAIKGEAAGKRWLVKHTWGEKDENPGLLHLDAEKRLHEVEVGTSFSLTFAPPVPMEWTELSPGEKKTLESKMTVAGFELALKYEATRLPDETVRVPAGEFTLCRHIQVVVHGTDAQGQPSKSRSDYWFHPKANGLVKEVTLSNYDTEAKQTSTSTLKAHSAP
jgi:hypothetical protein